MADLLTELLVTTKGLDEVVVHPEGWARVGAGVKWLPVIEAAAPYGLAALNGSSSDVGIVGYTTGGGVGPMARTYGIAADRVRAFDVVPANGSSADQSRQAAITAGASAASKKADPP
jgi:FAD/FMN-containing dehydrogenase